MKYELRGSEWHVCIEITANGAYITDGAFGEMMICRNELFTALLKDIVSGEKFSISSASGWNKVQSCKKSDELKLNFIRPDITVAITAKTDDTGISWSASVENRSDTLSVMELSYPAAAVRAEYFDFFAPVSSGLVVRDAGNNPDFENIFQTTSYLYPCGTLNMQYFAAYSEHSGIYFGFHDGSASTKRFDITRANGGLEVKGAFYGIGATLAKNSFVLPGSSRWQILFGDWYDASGIYAAFVRNESDWLPQIDENGRPDTAQRYKDIPFWINDYIPNSPAQGDNKPMSLASAGDSGKKDGWIEAPIALKNELGTPMAYHVYNWHEIPFNIDYPHFTPAKEEYLRGAGKLKENGIYLIPYINAVSWEMLDGEDGYEVNFENTGSHSAVVNEDGKISYVTYPQKKRKSGSPSMLAPICPSLKWAGIISDVSDEIARYVPSDGIYYDQIAAVGARPCYAKHHGHLPGGGSFWVEGYNKMMAQIREKKPADAYHLTESSAEPYIKSFDGYLTWTWVRDCMVPAYPAVYMGYIGMVGRCLDGIKKDDVEFFRFQIAQSFLYGQQLGWCKSDALYNEKKLEYLKIIVPIRYRYSTLFRAAKMCRPPKVTTSKMPVTTSPALWFTKDITMQQVLAGAFLSADGHATVLFLLNISESESDFSLEFDMNEYKVRNIPPEFQITDRKAVVSGTLAPLEIRIWEM